ncbi:MAG TPA: universal stress protein [Longimicrobium sp.]|nr:universal stress protein [Longimicrobium sp.]
MTPPAAPRSILAATDLTPACRPVLRAAGELALRSGGELHVVHAFDFPPSPYLEDTERPDSFLGRIADAERALRVQVLEAVPAGVRLGELRVEIYAAHRAVAYWAAAVEADVVVIGPHVRRDLELPFLGGTADRLLRTLEAPCLVVRGPLRLPLRRVLVPMDASEWARAALQVGLAWAGSLGDEAEGPVSVDVLHVAPRELAGGDAPFARAEVLPGWNRGLEEAVAESGAAARVRVREEVRFGDAPADGIVSAAEETRADLLVMATHGYGAVRRALLGGTAQAVARRAPCPVLLVPPRLWRDAPDS